MKGSFPSGVVQNSRVPHGPGPDLRLSVGDGCSLRVPPYTTMVTTLGSNPVKLCVDNS